MSLFKLAEKETKEKKGCKEREIKRENKHKMIQKEN